MIKRTSTIIVSLVFLVVLAFLVPIADQPETPFNEADTPKALREKGDPAHFPHIV